MFHWPRILREFGFFYIGDKVSRIAFFVDGFNLYHALEDVPAYKKYKWLNLRKLAESFITSKDTATIVIYFTTYVTWNIAKITRHKIYVEALRTVGVEPIFGAFRRKDLKCRVCRKAYQTYEEKQTDVNMAIKLFETAIENVWDTACIISGDSDLIPAIKAVKKTFPAKQIGIIIPIGRRAEELKAVTDFHRKIKEKHLRTCQLEDEITVGGGRKIVRPDAWI